MGCADFDEREFWSITDFGENSLFMASRWQAAGNQATVEVWPVGAHTLMNMGTPLAEAALARTTAWISEILR